MKRSNHRIDNSLRDALKDYSPGIPVPWSEMSVRVNNRKRGRTALFILVPVLLVLSMTAYSLFNINEDNAIAATLNAFEQNANKENTPARAAVPADTEAGIHPAGLLQKDNESPAVIKNPPRPAFLPKQNAPLTNAPGHNNDLMGRLLAGMICGSFHPTHPTRNLKEVNVPRRAPLKSQKQKLFYGSLAIRRENMQPRPLFTFDREKVHKDYEAMIRMQSPIANSTSYALQFGYMIFPRFGIESGVAIAQYQQYLKLDYTYREAPLYDGSTGKIVGYFELPASSQKQFSYESRNSLSLWQIPVNIFYRQPLGLRIYAEASAGAQYNIVGKVSGKFFDLEEVGLRELRRKDYSNSFSLRGSAGLFWLMNVNTTLGVEANLNRFISGLQSTDHYTLQPSVKTLQMSLKLNF